MPGVEVAVEGILREGVLEVLAVFDKPDPLEGPVLRGDDLRHAVAAPRDRRSRASHDADRARERGDRAHRGSGARGGARRRRPRLGHRGRGALDRRAVCAHAPVRRGHRLGGGDPASRARACRSTAWRGERTRGGRDDAADPPRGHAASRCAGGTTRARCRGSSGSRSRCRRAGTVQPLPEGDRYLGFLFARGDTPAAVEACAAGGPRRAGRRYRPLACKVHILLVSTYELGHQPRQPRCRRRAPAGPRPRGPGLDLSVDPWDPTLGEWADEVAISVPMHTAARLARDLARAIDRPGRVLRALRASRVAPDCRATRRAGALVEDAARRRVPATSCRPSTATRTS